MKKYLFIILMTILLSSGCGVETPTLHPDRENMIPFTQVKIQPETDIYPPKSFSSEFEDPVPLPYPINTAGAEDSAYIMPDGQTLYVWFTPNPQVSAEKQVSDGVTGIYVFRRIGNSWTNAERVWLQDSGKLSLDGCEFVLGNKIWFCTAREGYTGLHWFTAELTNGKWGKWQLADFPDGYEVGELHITGDGQELYFHSTRPGGQGEYDIWVSQNVNGRWGEPINLYVVNSPNSDGWPFVSPDGNELWFTRGPGAPELWRSMKVNGEWTKPEKMIGPFAGEASMDIEGNIYFTHHFYKEDVMLEADIYIAYRKTGR